MIFHDSKIVLITGKDKPNLTLDDMLKDPVIIKTNQKIENLALKILGKLTFMLIIFDKNIKKNNHKDTLEVIVVKKKKQLVTQYVTNKIYITIFKVEETNL